MPVQNILTVPKGEVLYKPFISMYPNFLNFGALRFVSRIGIRADDNNKETKSGSGEAAWAWKQFMLKIKRDFPVKQFPARPN